MTKEEILDKQYQPGMHWKVVNRAKVLQAIDQCTAPLEARIRDLEDVLNGFPGFNVISHSPDKMAQWAKRLTDVMEANLLSGAAVGDKKPNASISYIIGLLEGGIQSIDESGENVNIEGVKTLMTKAKDMLIKHNPNTI